MEHLKRPTRLVDFQDMFRSIYHEINTEKYPDDLLLILRLVEVVALLGKAARKDYREEIPKKLAHVFGWYVALANRWDMNLQKVAWHKFPGVCPYCLREENCSCGIEKSPIEDEITKTLNRLRYEREGREPETLDDHQKLHKTLYATKQACDELNKFVAHLLEEVAEVSEARRHQNGENLEDEMADVLYWILALSNRLQIELDDAVWHCFSFVCDVCRERPCTCKCAP